MKPWYWRSPVCLVWLLPLAIVYGALLVPMTFVALMIGSAQLAMRGEFPPFKK